MAEHTPTPWATELGFGSARVVATDHKGTFPICDIRGWGHLTGKGHGALGLSHDEGVAIQEANAALIVKAVNSHDALVKALQKVRSYNIDIADGRINYRPMDHVQVIDEALSTLVGGPR